MSAQSDAFVAKLSAAVARDVQRLALEVAANLIETTPVATGFARANWIPSFGEPVTEPSGSPAAVSDAQQQAALVAMLAYKLSDGAAYVSNNANYIQALNDGSSSQAPSGFVEAAIERAISTVNGSVDAVLL